MSSTHILVVDKHKTQWAVTVDFFPIKRHLKIWNPEDKFPHNPGGRIICQLIKYLKKLFEIYTGYISMMIEQFTFLQEGSNRILS